MRKSKLSEKQVILTGEYEKLLDLAKSRDWRVADVLRLGLLRFRLYDAMAKMTERQVGGVLARGRLTKSADGSFWRLKEDGRIRHIKGAEPDYWGLEGGENLFTRSTHLKTFFICEAIAPGQYRARFSNEKRESFELHLPDFYMSTALLRRVIAAGIHMEKEK